MKKLLILAPCLFLAACGIPKTEERLESEITLSNGKKYTWNCEYNNNGCYVYDFKSQRSIGYDSEYFCDLTQKFYIIKRQYRGGAVAIEQKGLTCKYKLEFVKYTTMVDGTEKVERRLIVKE